MRSARSTFSVEAIPYLLTFSFQSLHCSLIHAVSAVVENGGKYTFSVFQLVQKSLCSFNSSAEPL